MVASFISEASIRLPSSSGVRPTISPAMNTVRMTKISIPASPTPTPPGLTSPRSMLERVTVAAIAV